MQGRITRLIDGQSHMIGAIAHDLRTPLTRLSFRLDGLEPALKEKVEADVDSCATKPLAERGRNRICGC